MKKRVLLILFNIIFFNKTWCQSDSIIINEDPKLTKVLELKKLVNQETFTSGQYTVQIFSGNFKDSQELMNKINPVVIVALVLVVGFLAFKIMSFLGCYVRIEDVDQCWKLTAW